jgi:hypothetical protein
VEEARRRRQALRHFPGRKKSGDERFDEVAGEIINFGSGSVRGAFIAMAVTAGVLYGGYYAAKRSSSGSRSSTTRALESR